VSGADAVLVFGVFALSWIGTWAVRRYALARDLMDIPNERSSHEVPTPRGGGLPIALLVPLALLLAAASGLAPGPLAPALAISGALVALVGWIDDHGHVSAPIRMAVQGGAAALFLYLIGGMPRLTLFPLVLDLGLAGSLLAIVGIVWTTNYFNFMDGTDGLAGSEALLVGGVGSLLAFRAGDPSLALGAALCAAASGGFLLWNWPPAKVFMGDVGSSFLGFSFGALAVASEGTGSVSILVWIVLLGFFAFDSTVTLLRRVGRGERWSEPHRSHAYQRILGPERSHAWLLVRVWLLNIGLAATAVGMVTWPRLSLVGVLLAVLTLTLLYRAVGRCAPMRPQPSNPADQS